MTINFASVGRFFRLQRLYILISVFVGAIFWATGQQINPLTVILYSLCIGNLITFSMIRLQFLYSERSFPYNWMIFLASLLVLTFPIYAISSVIVWWIAPPSPQSLSDLITKGWQFPSLITLAFGVVTFLYSATKERLERRNKELQRSIDHSVAQLEMQEQEMGRAREIQQSLLPKEIPQLAGFEVAGAWHPAQMVGGDYFDVLRLGDNRLAICIADVVGKGVAAALLMANVQATVRAFARDSESPAGVCGRINSVLCGNIAADKFVTFFYGVLDGNARTLRYCNAGHLYPIFVSSGSVRRLDQGSAVLGVFPAWKYEDSIVALSSGDRLLLFTDGISEASGSDGLEFGEDNIAAFAKAHLTSSASELNNGLLAQVTGFCGVQFQDDATLLTVIVE
jgi:sigma-B regulation protein RsbU (phosphoserine phosphatase)